MTSTSTTPVKKKDPTAVQSAILAILRRYGPLTDPAILALYRRGQLESSKTYPIQSESGLRTRRAELVRLGLVRAEEHRTILATGRTAALWSLVPIRKPRPKPKPLPAPVVPTRAKLKSKTKLSRKQRNGKKK